MEKKIIKYISAGDEMITAKLDDGTYLELIPSESFKLRDRSYDQMVGCDYYDLTSSENEYIWKNTRHGS